MDIVICSVHIMLGIAWLEVFLPGTPGSVPRGGLQHTGYEEPWNRGG